MRGTQNISNCRYCTCSRSHEVKHFKNYWAFFFSAIHFKLPWTFPLFAAVHVSSKAASSGLNNRWLVDALYLIFFCKLPADIQPNYSHMLECNYSQKGSMSFNKEIKRKVMSLRSSRHLYVVPQICSSACKQCRLFFWKNMIIHCESCGI